jgi:hypothetical protein
MFNNFSPGILPMFPQNGMIMPPILPNISGVSMLPNLAQFGLPMLNIPGLNMPNLNFEKPN